MKPQPSLFSLPRRFGFPQRTSMDGRSARSTSRANVDWPEVEAVFARVVACRGRVGMLVNSAGIALRCPTVEYAAADCRVVVEVTPTRVVLCCRAAKHRESMPTPCHG